MNVDFDDEQDSNFFTSLASLRRYDVPSSRARQLRRQCHAMMRKEPAAIRSAPVMDAFRRVAVPALGAAWCLAYLAEIIRTTAAIYSYFGTQ